MSVFVGRVHQLAALGEIAAGGQAAAAVVEAAKRANEEYDALIP
jgi:hypothetical protein